MKKFRLLFSIAFFLISFIFNLSAQTSKMSMTILDTYSDSIKRDTLARFSAAIAQQLAATNKFAIKARDQLDKVLKMMDIKSDDNLDEKQAADIGGKMGSEVVVFSTGAYRNNNYYLSVKVIKSVTGTLYAEVQNEFKDIRDIDNSLPTMISYLVDEIVLIDSYFTRNYLFFTESEASYNEKAAKNPTLNLPSSPDNTSTRTNSMVWVNDPRNFFSIYRLNISLQGGYNGPVGEYTGFILPSGYFSILADYVLYTTDYFAISPLIGLNYSVYDIDPALIKDINLLPMSVFGVLFGGDFALSLPTFRMLSFHLKSTGGFTINLFQVDDGKNKILVGNYPFLHFAFETRLTFMQKLSLSFIVNYMRIFSDSDFVMIQDIKIGGGLGYRF